jgi:hypothetical protein
MTVSQLINKLNQIKENTGDLEVLFSVNDQFSNQGNDATMFMRENEEYWENTKSNGVQIRLEIMLKNYDGKRAKVTFRN